MPRPCVRSVFILLCISLTLSACATNTAIPQPADGQRVDWIRLRDGVTVNVSPPHVARWEDDRLVIRDGSRNIVTTLLPEQISELGSRHLQTRVFLKVGLVVVLVAVVFMMLNVAATSDSWSPSF
jgi:hypothetical protein